LLNYSITHSPSPSREIAIANTLERSKTCVSSEAPSSLQLRKLAFERRNDHFSGHCLLACSLLFHSLALEQWEPFGCRRSTGSSREDLPMTACGVIWRHASWTHSRNACRGEETQTAHNTDAAKGQMEARTATKKCRNAPILPL